MVQLLINDVVYPTKYQDSISIDRTASDPVPTFKVKLQDDPSRISISELMDCVIIDEAQLPNPAHNLLLNPLLSPYTTNWIQQSTSGGTYTAVNPGVTLAVSNISANFGLLQTTQPGLIAVGLPYCFSAYITVNVTLHNCQWFVQINYLDGNQNVLSSQLSVGTASGRQAILTSQSGGAPAGAVYAQANFGIMPLVNGNNSGSITVTVTQLEPMSFASGNAYVLAYPTPDCNGSQVNCRLLPDGTCVRQARLFGGVVTKADAGEYVGNLRKWNVQVAGYGWMLQKQLLNQSWSNQRDSAIITQIVATYFAKYFTTNHVVQGALLDTFGYQYNGTARDAFDALAGNANYFYWVDDYRDIWYQAPGFSAAQFGLSDTPDFITTFPYFGYNLSLDGTQLGNATLVTGATNISAIEYDAQSIGYYNEKTNGQGTFWRLVNDTTITTTASAQQRAIAENSQFNYARKIVTLTCNQILQPGLTVQLTSLTDDLASTPFLAQKTTLTIKGISNSLTPVYECACELGDYNPDLVNITVKMLRQQSKTTNSIGTPVIGLMVTEQMHATEQVHVTTIPQAGSTYGLGIYGTSTYAATIPGEPPTTYGVGTYGDANHGYL
jgi:hypothetical protein